MPIRADDRSGQCELVDLLTRSASVGVAVQRSGSHAAGDRLRDADIAMYNAKFSGKNTLVWFDSVLRDRITTGPRSSPAPEAGRIAGDG